MPTSTTASFDRSRPPPPAASAPPPRTARHDPQRGFTLLEIALVLLILGVAMSFAMPRFRDPSRLDLSSNVRRLATTFRLLRNEAIMNGHTYRLNYDLDQQRYWISIEEGGRNTADLLQNAGPLARPVRLPDTVAFSDVVLQSIGKLNQGQVFTRFFPDGFVDPTIVHMDNGREAYTLNVWPLTGQVTIYEGYRDLEFAS